jgi:exosortase B
MAMNGELASTDTAALGPLGARRWPPGLDPVALALVLAGFIVLAVPTFWDLTRGTWAYGAQGHELVIIAVSALLVFRKRHQLAGQAIAAARFAGGTLFALGLVLHVLGRAYDLRLALISIIVLAASLLLWYRGWAAVRTVWFGLAFMLFALPLPLEFVLAVTGPMKIGVSAMAAQILSAVGYPIGRSGVVLTIGQYQLLVTEACAGLQTMFTLEAMGLLYASLINHESPARNALLAVLVVPIAFLANVVRVIVLALITFHFGDAAGQGFLHGFSGIVLFLVALAMVIATDGLLGRLPIRWGGS